MEGPDTPAGRLPRVLRDGCADADHGRNQAAATLAGHDGRSILADAIPTVGSFTC